ncbi:hypothetical protein [Desulfosporosinus sp. FKA]|uniref:hypothetical protein n=1 Tax=Desulfosporosinus sp. FKA TaxID=1969834 RepID=UPI000B49A723|nr:hypothetical protein [Desulfosporosinus sp. FKA]
MLNNISEKSVKTLVTLLFIVMFTLGTATVALASSTVNFENSTVSNITGSSATINGSLSGEYTSNEVKSYGVLYFKGSYDVLFFKESLDLKSLNANSQEVTMAAVTVPKVSQKNGKYTYTITDLNLTGLSSNTEYYYCEYIYTSGKGYELGPVSNFTTLAKVVTTEQANNIEANEATLNGTVDKGKGKGPGPGVADTGFYCSAVASTLDQLKNTNELSSEEVRTEKRKWKFSRRLTGLQSGTKYYYVAYETKDGVTNFGSVECFTTTVKYQGVQKRNKVNISCDNRCGDRYDLRFLATIDTLNADSVGFVYSESNHNPTIEDGTCSKVIPTTTVYDEVTVEGKKVSAHSRGGNYFIACILKDIPEKTKLYVRAFSTIGGVTTYTSAQKVDVHKLR